MIVTDQSCIYEEAINRLKSENACYHSVPTFLSCKILSNETKIKVRKTIILPIVYIYVLTPLLFNFAILMSTRRPKKRKKGWNRTEYIS
jgi:transposase-like protein